MKLHNERAHKDNSNVKANGKAAMAEKKPKPFQFRSRLWHEPPCESELDHPYADKMCYDSVQKDFKFSATSPSDLEWKTNWLDLWTEQELLLTYESWINEQEWRKDITEQEKTFYNGLGDCISADLGEVMNESDANNERHGRNEDDEEMLWEFMDKQRKEWMGKEGGG